VKVEIDADTLDVAPHFAGRLIRGVKNGPSAGVAAGPAARHRAAAHFGAGRYHQLLHLRHEPPAARLRRRQGARDSARPSREGGETLEALDEKTYTFAPGHTLISDDNGVESIAGIMGGEASGCTEETVNVFLESAYWDPIHTAYTGRDLKINSDARYRFERGVDPDYTCRGWRPRRRWCWSCAAARRPRSWRPARR
jgi:phenylalanyl-tRNA synthetase beta chain